MTTFLHHGVIYTLPSYHSNVTYLKGLDESQATGQYPLQAATAALTVAFCPQQCSQDRQHMLVSYDSQESSSREENYNSHYDKHHISSIYTHYKRQVLIFCL